MGKIDAFELARRWKRYADMSWTRIYDGERRNALLEEAERKPDGFEASPTPLHCPNPKSPL